MVRNKWILVSLGALLILGIVSALIYHLFAGSKVSYQETNGLFVISNSKYEIAFRADNGGIAYVQDKQFNDKLSVGNRDNVLWWAFMNGDQSVNSKKMAHFSYEWNAGAGELLLHYAGELKVDVTVTFGQDNRIGMRAKVVNDSENTIQSFRFPYELKASSDQVVDGLLPMLPGAKLKPAFFTENNSFEDQYPGVMFASLISLRTQNGNLSLYDLHSKDKLIASQNLGFKNQVDDAGKTAFVHNYTTLIKPKSEWSTPLIVMEIGGDYPNIIQSYREMNQIAAYRSLADKLGKDKESYLQLPFMKLDISALGQANWGTLASNYVDQMDYASVLHLVGFQKGGHDENYPDFLPPDPKWGSEAELRAFIQYAKDKGNRIVPYTNFSWWGVHSPTLQALPTGVDLNDIVVQQQSGNLIKEDYGSHSGYVMNMNHPYVVQRIEEEHKKLLEAGMDGIFEDQWGIRNAPFLYNEGYLANADESSAYFEGVRKYFANSSHHMYTEDGTDVLANDTVGFMGTNYLWDLLGYRKKTASYTDYYPMVSMLLRDKVMLYQHDLAAETMTDTKDMLRWNLAMGYQLSGDLFHGTDNPWIHLVGAFQKYVLAPYGDALVKDYKQLGHAVTETQYDQYAVIANWDTEKSYVINDQHTLTAGGFEVSAKDQSVRAGSYTRYNGTDLDHGEHYLIELRSDNSIRIYQPIGSDTTLSIQKNAKWKHAFITAYEANGNKVADLPVSEAGDRVQFDYVRLINGLQVDYVELTGSDVPSMVKDVSFGKMKEAVNLALRKEIVSSTDTAKEFPASLTVDGDPFTYWESMPKRFPQSITVNLGEQQSISRIGLSLPPLDAWEARTEEIEILGSSDGQTFQTIRQRANVVFDPRNKNRVELQVDGAVNLQYIRLNITENTAWPAAQISEIEIYSE
ncbi:discoidin domain-containing protein [Paenibacillus albiflavus]|uniref:discoidin domain-containing protein n=1 Tax=Paenibacillus albiflavus TaxID=2545760 RepID=UPI001F272523|nr:discoidin domain-containing protein [Paenibacillus albiflavus]